ncbi:MAG TPA: response regulator transcription factor [Vicinamibacterales bacterium]|nr:response regulator transcription factor [Vicinamibacterales bacterium]
MSLPRVLLADDHTLLLDALEKLLSDEWNIVAKVHDGGTLLRAVETLQPDVVVLDIAMPPMNGLELGREIKHRFPSLKLIFLTMSADPDLAADAFRMGASAYVLKHLAASDLSRAMHEVIKGGRYIPPSLTQGVVHSLVKQPKSVAVDLTPRQREVLRLLASGYAMKEVAAALNISSRTVAFHKYQIMAQLGIKSSAELIQYAIRQAIV